MQVPVRDDDIVITELVRGSGFTSSQHDTTAWLDSDRLPAIGSLPAGFALTDRSLESTTPHPMIGRSGPHVEEGLQRCSLYDPSLDLAVRTADGDVAGYSLYWFDRRPRSAWSSRCEWRTRTNDAAWARAMLIAGVNRLAQKGARRIKISWESEAAGALYTGVGFRPTSRCTWFTRE